LATVASPKDEGLPDVARINQQSLSFVRLNEFFSAKQRIGTLVTGNARTRSEAGYAGGGEPPALD
jgi:hypothetical protein